MKLRHTSYLLIPTLVILLLNSKSNADFTDELPGLSAGTPTPAPKPTAIDSIQNKKNSKKTSEKFNSQNNKTDKAKQQPNPQPTTDTASPAAGNAEQGGLFGPDVRTHNTAAPIILKNGDTLEGSLKSGKMSLKGNVELVQGDTVLKADACELFSKPGSTAAEKAVAKGNVVLRKKPGPGALELRAQAEEIEYFVLTRKVILRGRPKVWRGHELLQGEEINLNLDTEEVSVRGASAVVDPKMEPGKDSKSSSKSNHKSGSSKKDSKGAK